jgi:muramoyltetrapeptide carboxypeptidase
VAAGDPAHRRIAVAGERRLDDRKIELEITDAKHVLRLYCPDSETRDEDHMPTGNARPTRVHLLAHANPATKDVKRFRFANTPAYLRFIRQHLPAPLRLTCTPRLFDVVEDQQRGGRRDDAARIRDVQDALDDPATLAIVAAAGGAYFSRILPHLDFSPLARRRTPLWALGFSEMTNFVNLVASYRGGRGLYWLCPNYLGWQISPRSRGRAAFAEFWQTLPRVLAGKRPIRASQLTFANVKGRLARGTVRSRSIRLVGGCLSVLVAMLAGPLARRLRPDGCWLAIEDLQEPPYRIDRHLATLKLAGWFERVAGILVGAFHDDDEDQQAAVLELLSYHLPSKRRVPVVTTHSFGHVWPMVPLELNRPVKMTVAGRRVSIGA